MWFHSKIKYGVQDALGKWKTYSEQFLHDAITYAEVEQQLAEFLQGRVSDYEYTITKISFDAVYDTFIQGSFYKVTFEEKTTNDAGADKITVKAHLVAAADVTDAERRATDYMKNWITDTTIIGSDRTKILGVWHPKSEDWKNDFKERMLRLAEVGQESNDSNQTTLFNRDGTVKKPGDSNQDTDAPANEESDFSKWTKSAEGTLTKKAKGKKITFLKKNGEPVEA
ncbi:DUF4494 family protein [Spirosoma flavum]|uniref:DUF4494 family protein n=1 Tax=Spirosoma flavum TaxID=2048557 RepID=A0ABW6APE0_9BACT